ncbi:hypothetical protein P8C59_007192 [Phyllachora maydis]|uniref:Uncharacterized protein n=1 Tax=Phyllachora maydis TaxID=1825666 RepID=A0AAD9I818_9PEZI|nr:hypothetical protein P8C59_007192 [Phyllachora maydis]
MAEMLGRIHRRIEGSTHDLHETVFRTGWSPTSLRSIPRENSHSFSPVFGPRAEFPADTDVAPDTHRDVASSLLLDAGAQIHGHGVGPLLFSPDAPFAQAVPF